jgi:HSP20 family protein
MKHAGFIIDCATGTEEDMMAVVRWEPLREFTALQNEMGRLLGQMWGTPGGVGAGNGPSSWLPALDVWETEDELVLALDLPGIEEDKVNVEVDDGVLTVSGQRDRTVEVKDEHFARFERRYGTFSRSVTLPQGIDEGKIAAEFTNGVLQIHVPKPEERKPKRIQIGDNPGAIEGQSSRK